MGALYAEVHVHKKWAEFNSAPYIRLMRFYFIFFFFLCTSGCEIKPKSPRISTPSPILNELANSVPIQILNIDSLEKAKITLDSESLIYSVFQASDTNEPILGDIWDAVEVNNTIYVYDFSSKAIYTVDTKGRVEGPHTREGRGPGEHLGVGVIRANARYIYATDPNNGRINRYTFDMKEYFSIPLQIFGSIALNDEIMLYENTAPDKGEMLLTIVSMNSILDTVTTLMPKIVPIGYEPFLYNKLLFSVNQKGEIIVSYAAFPLIFIFDNEYQHIQTLFFEYSLFKELESSEFKVEKKPTGKVYHIQRPFVYHKLMDNGDIIIGIDDELIYLTANKNGKYKAKRILFDQFDNANNAAIMVIGSSKDMIFAKNGKYLYNFIISSD